MAKKFSMDRDCIGCTERFIALQKDEYLCPECYERETKELAKQDARTNGNFEDYDPNWFEDNLGLREWGPPRTSNEIDDFYKAYEETRD